MAKHLSARRGFDFTQSMRSLCDDMVTRVPQLSHIRLEYVALRLCRARQRTSHGIYASLTPLRFEGGATETVKRNRRFGVQRVLDDAGREMLYILSFYIPRFLDQTPRFKLDTIIHELWHIGPRFDGDIRRHDGRCYAHTGSQKEYDAQVAKLTDLWLAAAPSPDLYEFLNYDADGLLRKFGTLVGHKIRNPRLIPLR
jgi:predicted metallopeptidase